MGILAVLLGTITGLSTAIPFVILALFVLGVGNGTVIPIATGIVLRYLPMADAGVGGAILMTGQQLAGTLGIVFAEASFSWEMAHLSPRPPPMWTVSPFKCAPYRLRSAAPLSSAVSPPSHKIHRDHRIFPLATNFISPYN